MLLDLVGRFYSTLNIPTEAMTNPRIIRYGEEGDVRGFVDNVLLVPNWDSHGPKAPKGLKKWLVQTQNFRLIF